MGTRFMFVGRLNCDNAQKGNIIPCSLQISVTFILGQKKKKSDASHTYAINLIGSECNPLVEMSPISMLLLKSGQHLFTE